MDGVDKYCSFIFGYFGRDNGERLNLTVFGRISNYIFDRNFSRISQSRSKIVKHLIYIIRYCTQCNAQSQGGGRDFFEKFG